MRKSFSLKFLKQDIPAGVIVFLIALPLCLGIAQASGTSPFSGLISGVIGGIVIGLFSKSALSVSGPAAGLIGIIAPGLILLGNGDPMAGFPLLLCSVIIAGVLQVLLGIARAGGLANYFPSNVIEGMLAGIGLTIIIKEIPNALGIDKTALSEGEEGFRATEFSGMLSHIQPAAVIISVVGILLLLLWQTKLMKRVRLLPAGLFVVLIGVLVNEYLVATGSSLALMNGPKIKHLVNLDASKGLLDQFTFPNFQGLLNKDVWILGFTIAAVASIETLLCIEATDKLDPLKRYTPGNAELRAQGIGNILAGCLGGLPITSVIVRSSANIYAGAKSRASTVLHGALLLVAVASIPFLLNHIPKAALAAILIYTGYKLCKPSSFVKMWKGGATQWVPFLATVICVVALDLLKGVGIGLVISIIFMLRQNAKNVFFFQRSSYSKGELIKITLSQEVSFLNKAAIKETLRHLPENCSVIVDASNTDYVDFDILDLLRDFQAGQAVDKSITVSLIGFKNTYKVPVGASEWEIASPLVAQNEVPQRTAGDYKKLLRQLKPGKPEADE